MKKGRTFGNSAINVAILILALIAIYCGLQILESTIYFDADQDETKPVSKTVTRDGIDYFPRQDITVFMIMGIDQNGVVQSSDAYYNNGEADVVLLVVFDDTSNNYTILVLNRDTMLDIPVLGIGGREVGTTFGQLALAHTYGSGLEDSCENTVKAVSSFLYDIRIDYYAAMNMDAIGILADAVDGIKVNVVDDFSQVDPSLPVGEVVLTSENALTYVRTRMGVGDQLNLSRMERHKDFLRGFLEAFNAKVASNDAFVLHTYERLLPYMVTDCSTTVITDLFCRLAEYTLEEIVSPEGENEMGTQFIEHYVDESRMDELILQLFYLPK